MDNEITGNGNQYDYGFRIYNPRLGKFLSVDPLTKDYPSWTPYPYAMNRPIQCIDIDGLESGWVDIGQGRQCMQKGDIGQFGMNQFEPMSIPTDNRTQLKIEDVKKNDEKVVSVTANVSLNSGPLKVSSVGGGVAVNNNSAGNYVTVNPATANVKCTNSTTGESMDVKYTQNKGTTIAISNKEL